MAGLRIGVIGTGTIAQAVVTGIADRGHRICVSRRSAARSAALAARVPGLQVADPPEVLDQADLVLLGLRETDATAVLPQLRFRADHQVVSMIAGLSAGDLAELVAPAQVAAVMIPFPAIARGGAPVLVLGDTALVARMLGPDHPIVDLPDTAALNACLCAQAILSPLTAQLAMAADWLAERLDPPGRAETFLRQLLTASLSGQDSASLLADLSTPGGFNARLRAQMRAAGAEDALREGLDQLERSL